MIFTTNAWLSSQRDGPAFSAHIRTQIISFVKSFSALYYSTSKRSTCSRRISKTPRDISSQISCRIWNSCTQIISHCITVQEEKIEHIRNCKRFNNLACFINAISIIPMIQAAYKPEAQINFKIQSCDFNIQLQMPVWLHYKWILILLSLKKLECVIRVKIRYSYWRCA